MNTMKKCLFGGALVGAGLCSTAVAGHLEWTGGFATVSGDSGPVGAITSGPSWAATSPGFFDFGTASGDTSGAYMAVYSGYFGFNASSVLDSTTFTVNTTTTFTFEWAASGFGFLSVDIVGAGIINPDLNFVSGSGMFDLTFLATETYTIDANLFAGGNSLATFRMTENAMAAVPLPPAAFAGLGMLAGLGAYRRIRK